MIVRAHPGWCLRDQCADEAHRSRLVILKTVSGDFAPVRIQLVQPWLLGARPFVVIVGDEGQVTLSPRQARALAHVCLQRVRDAERAAGTHASGRRVTGDSAG
jgi:hypothetical protein